MGEKKDYSKVKITHIMADGSERDSVKGYIVDANQLSATTRRIIYELFLNPQREVTHE